MSECKLCYQQFEKDPVDDIEENVCYQCDWQGLKNDISDLKEANNVLNRLSEQDLKQIADLKKENEKFKKYARHNNRCDSSGLTVCICGLDDLLNKA